MQFDDRSTDAGGFDSSGDPVPRPVSSGEVTLRPAVFDLDLPQAIDDARFLLELRNEPGYRSMAVDTRIIGWEKHIAWYKNSGPRPGRHIWIIQSGSEQVGMVRLDGQKRQHFVEVSISLSPECRGRGFGTAVLGQACAEAVRLGYDTVQARIRQSNPRSLRAFQKAGFVVTGQQQLETDTICLLQWQPAMPR